jgi:regulator of sigma E protease
MAGEQERMHILKTIFIILEVLVLFNLVIFVHELGHFLAARWRGLKVERFAIWFGTPIWKKKINGVEYSLNSIPFGGYVALPQMAPMELIEGKNEEQTEPLPPISPLDKIIVAFAGPLFSFLLAFAFAFVVWGVGKPDQNAKDSTLVGWVVPDGPAWKAGLRPGDQITEVDGHTVTHFGATSQDSVTWRIVTSEGETIPIKYLRDGHEMTAQITPIKLPTKWYERKSLRKVMIDYAQPAIIGDVATNSPASLVGLRAGDEVTMLDGKKVLSPHAIIDVEDLLSNAPPKPVVFEIRRGTNQFEVTMLPVKPVKPAQATPSFGITAWLFNGDNVIIHPTPMSQISESAGMIFATLKTVVSPKSDVGIQQLGGAVMIIRAYKNFFDSENGWRRVLWFSVVLNINLALINLLPFPVLDGGHIMLALVEAVRRRPVSAKVLQVLQSACMMIVIAFMLFIAFYDTGDWLRSAKEDHEQPIEFARPQN